MYSKQKLNGLNAIFTATDFGFFFDQLYKVMATLCSSKEGMPHSLINNTEMFS